MGVGERMKNYVCCFCGNRIEGTVTALVAIANWNTADDSEQQASQQLFCHLNCIRNVVYNPNHIYIEED